jgi:hypothetical protein
MYYAVPWARGVLRNVGAPRTFLRTEAPPRSHATALDCSLISLATTERAASCGRATARTASDRRATLERWAT